MDVYITEDRWSKFNRNKWTNEQTHKKDKQTDGLRNREIKPALNTITSACCDKWWQITVTFVTVKHLEKILRHVQLPTFPTFDIGCATFDVGETYIRRSFCDICHLCGIWGTKRRWQHCSWLIGTTISSLWMCLMLQKDHDSKTYLNETNAWCNRCSTGLDIF